MGAKATAIDQDEAGDSPLRLCAVSRTQKHPDDLVRFVLGPEDTIAPDLARRLPGRGVWVDATRSAVTAAARQNVFARSLKKAVAVPEDLPGLVEKLMVKRLREAVSIANKAGLLVTGFTKVQDLMDGGRATVLIHAADAALDGAAKLDRKFKALVGPEAAEAATVNDLTGPELDLAIGRANVVHAAACQGGASQRILQEAKRLRRYRLDGQASSAAQVAFGADIGSA
jgi:predicted RNA-binding protein YlxR (DUF448 family)